MSLTPNMIYKRYIALGLCVMSIAEDELEYAKAQMDSATRHYKLIKKIVEKRREKKGKPVKLSVGLEVE